MSKDEYNVHTFKLGEKMMKAWEAYAKTGGPVAWADYLDACENYEAAEKILDEMEAA